MLHSLYISSASSTRTDLILDHKNARRKRVQARRVPNRSRKLTLGALCARWMFKKTCPSPNKRYPTAKNEQKFFISVWRRRQRRWLKRDYNFRQFRDRSLIKMGFFSTLYLDRFLLEIKKCSWEVVRWSSLVLRLHHLQGRILWMKFCAYSALLIILTEKLSANRQKIDCCSWRAESTRKLGRQYCYHANRKVLFAILIWLEKSVVFICGKTRCYDIISKRSISVHITRS